MRVCATFFVESLGSALMANTFEAVCHMFAESHNPD
jgi:hypothetical protein